MELILLYSYLYIESKYKKKKENPILIVVLLLLLLVLRLYIDLCTILLYRVKVQALEEELHIDWSSTDSTAGT